MFDADVYVNTGAFELAVEIAMEDTDRERQHVEDHFDTGFDTVWVVCRNTGVQEGLEDRLADAELDSQRIIFHEVNDFTEI